MDEQMLHRKSRWLVLFIGALVSGFALGQTAININPPPAGPLSYGSLAAADTAVANNTTVHTLSINAASTWNGTTWYGLFNTAGNTIDTGGFTVNAGATVYGGTAGIQNAAGATITGTSNNAITNFGTIGKIGVLLSTDGIYNNGTISNGVNRSIFNLGLITGSNSGIFNDTAGTITNTSGNSAIITQAASTTGGAGATYGIYNNGTISSPVAFGSGAIDNAGTISGSNSGIYNAATISGTGVLAVNNTGTITGNTAGLYNAAAGTITSANLDATITNTGTMGGASSQYGIYNAGTITNSYAGLGASVGIANQTTGTIQGTIAGIYNAVGAEISVTSAGSVGILNINTSTITSITNLGTITGDLAGISNQSTATIGTLTNAQGQVTALVYRNKLPTNYNVVINSTLDYGKLSLVTPLGSTNFGVTPTSTIVVNTYTAVLSGVTSANLLANQVGGTVTGTLNGLNWTLSPQGGAPTIWDLIVTTPGGGGGGGSGGSSGGVSGSSSGGGSSPTPAGLTNIVTNGSFGLSTIGVTTNPVFDGGTLTLTSGANTSQPFTITSSGGTISTPSGGSATMTGGLTGTGPMAINGGGTLLLAGTNTYTGGTTISGNTSLSIAGSSPLGSGAIFVASGSSLSGSGTIGAPVTVSGTLHPGNSPGYLALTQPLTINAGATFQQDIAGKAQASATSPAGATGYYSFTQVTGAGVTISPGATLNPRLQNLFSLSESGYGSTPYTPVVGDKFRIMTADGGITGKFTTLTQPAGLASGTQFLQFYNYSGSNSLDLAVAPSSYSTASSGNKNAQSVGSALDKLVVANQTGVSTSTQDALLYPVSGQSIANLGSYLQGMSGEIYGATLAVVPQTTQRLQAAVLSRLGDSMFVATRGMAQVTPATNSAISATNPGGQPTAAMSSNPNVNPYGANSGSGSMRNGAAWGEIAYQYGNRSSDSNSGGWSSNLVQAVVGLDAYSQGGTKAGGGLALSNTNVTAAQGSGTVQQGTLFLYGKMPVGEFVVDGMASYGFNSTNNTRNDPTGITGGLQAKNVQGNDALVSAGVSMPIETESATLAPYARVTWQNVSQNGFNEGSAASALTVNSYNGNGVRGVIGLTAGSKATDPIKEKYTYKANVGVGVDSNAVLSPTLNASIAGQGTQIYTPNPSAAFVQVGIYGTAKIADNAYAYAGVTSELRGGQALVGGNVGVMIQF